MATRRRIKSRKSGRTRRFGRRHRASVAGKIMPPLDVRSKGHLGEFKKRIKQGPLTIVLVYADWCGHCHTMMPHFDAASKSPNRSIQSVKVNEQMLPHVNEFVNKSINRSAKPFNVEGYPSIIMVDNQGNKVTDIEPVRNTSTMTKVMENSGSLAKNSGMLGDTGSIGNTGLVNTYAKNTSKDEGGLKESANRKNLNVGEEELKGSIASENRNKKNTNSIKKNLNTGVPLGQEQGQGQEQEQEPVLEKPKSIKVTPKTANAFEKEAEETTSLIAPVMPPSITSDIEDIDGDITEANSLSGGGKGGSLLSALTRTTYTLAPAATLMATAALVMKRNGRGKTHKRIKKHRKTIRRHR